MSDSRKIPQPITILLADDSEDDRLMTREAMAESFVINSLIEVEDGEELMDYLHRRGEYDQTPPVPRPGLILLDLNMPRKSGKEALEEIKADPILRRIPIVVLTTSDDADDIERSYELGVSSFITKPVTFSALVDVMKTFGKYWIEIVAIPYYDEE
ncbi:MAG TPA: response regulator [Abditibacteriaceae bacterium]|jgi:CheY-like chemotaxis protein